MPTEWPRKLITGWTPPGICTACGEGRRAATSKKGEERDAADSLNRGRNGHIGGGAPSAKNVSYTITGEACACDQPTAPTTPAVVLDPFGGTGTTAMVARALGRYGVSCDLSADYLRLADWRIFHSGQAARVAAKTAADQQVSMFDQEVPA